MRWAFLTKPIDQDINDLGYYTDEPQYECTYCEKTEENCTCEEEE